MYACTHVAITPPRCCLTSNFTRGIIRLAMLGDTKSFGVMSPSVARSTNCNRLVMSAVDLSRLGPNTTCEPLLRLS